MIFLFLILLFSKPNNQIVKDYKHFNSENKMDIIKITKNECEEDERPLIIEAASSSVSSSAKKYVDRKCDICSKPKPQYTCPRCQKSYCNLTCYQSPEHMTCSEEFYKDQVLEQLKDCRIEEDDKKTKV